ncbi:hypothetical protein L0F63_003458 [Massospora cicadina]|nr:hypothetical protein L0F63_003458 [Massospora cicadina]
MYLIPQAIITIFLSGSVFAYTVLRPIQNLVPTDTLVESIQHKVDQTLETLHAKGNHFWGDRFRYRRADTNTHDPLQTNGSHLVGDRFRYRRSEVINSAPVAHPPRHRSRHVTEAAPVTRPPRRLIANMPENYSAAPVTRPPRHPTNLLAVTEDAAPYK